MVSEFSRFVQALQIAELDIEIKMDDFLLGLGYGTKKKESCADFMFRLFKYWKSDEEFLPVSTAVS